MPLLNYRNNLETFHERFPEDIWREILKYLPFSEAYIYILSNLKNITDEEALILIKVIEYKVLKNTNTRTGWLKGFYKQIKNKSEFSKEIIKKNFKEYNKNFFSSLYYLRKFGNLHKNNFDLKNIINNNKDYILIYKLQELYSEVTKILLFHQEFIDNRLVFILFVGTVLSFIDCIIGFKEFFINNPSGTKVFVLFLGLLLVIVFIFPIVVEIGISRKNAISDLKLLRKKIKKNIDLLLSHNEIEIITGPL